MRKRNAVLGIVLSCIMLFGICMFQVQSNNAVLKYSSNIGYVITEDCAPEIQAAASGAVGAMGWLAGAKAGAYLGAQIGWLGGPAGETIGIILGAGIGAL